jgi:hypothetical protein
MEMTTMETIIVISGVVLALGILLDFPRTIVAEFFSLLTSKLRRSKSLSTVRAIARNRNFPNN